MMIFQERKNILLILVFLISVIDGSRNCTTPLPLASCPKNTHIWRLKAKNLCKHEVDLYHCLVTQTDTLVECCMTPKTIGAGQYPQYNTIKNEIQAIDCEIDYYMPSAWPSNKFLRNGPRHCQYEKSKCNMMGMKICSDGNTTSDRTCKCDYMNKYVPDIKITEPCFDERDIRCLPTMECPGLNEEINMKYNCVKVCEPGFYRPEGTMDCEVVPESTSQSTSTKNDVTTKDIKDDMSSNMIYPTELNITTLVGVSIMLILLIVIVAVLVVLIKTGKTQSIKCCFTDASTSDIDLKNVIIGSKNRISETNYPLIQEINPALLHHEPMVGSSVVLKFKIGSRNNISSFEVEWLKDGNTVETSRSRKYKKTTTTSNSSLTINDITKDDTGHYSIIVDGTESSIITVTVKEPVITLPKIHSAICGDNLTLGFTIEHRPSKYIVFWKKRKGRNDQDQILEPSDKYEDTDSEYLTISNICEDDEGYYSCWIIYEVCGTSFQVPADIDNIIMTKVNVNKGQGGIVHQHIAKKTDVTINQAENVHLGNDTNVNLMQTNSTGNGSANKAISGSSNPGGVSEKSSSSGSECSESDSNESDSSEKGLIRSNSDEKNAADTNNSGSTVGSHQMVNTNSSGLTAGGNQLATNSDNMLDVNKPRSTLLSQIPVTNNIDITSIKQIAERKKFTVKNVQADGNCLFHAVAYQLCFMLISKHILEKSKELRQKIVDFLKNNDKTPNGESYSSFLSCNENKRLEEWTKYLEGMCKLGEYGDEIIVRAISHCFNVNIWVLSTRTPNDFIKYPAASSTETVYLGFIHDSLHYVRLLSQEEQ
ncbi:uncharacterized protein LOC134710635 [Mytilus trossulus]|uniref:uncharacterized protein LOC134710635 n=1 Tax=Mytilus trossulus TaxID=6551 RepID=UPI003007158A